MIFCLLSLWSAIANDSECSNTSDTWSFTTRSDSPVGGIYVWGISFTSVGPHLKSIVTIRRDSNNNGTAEETDDLVSGATVTFNLTHPDSGEYNIYSDTTDETGTVTFQWKKAPAGNYEGFIIDVEHSYTYNSVLNVENSDTYTH